jgi:hypothetical protein
MNGNISLVLAEDSGDFRLERAWAFPIFDFDNYRLPSADKIQHVIKQRDPLDGAGKAERRDFGGSRQAYSSVQAGESKQTPVVEDDRAAIRTHLHVDLDGEALLDGLFYRRERILRAILVVEAAMSYGGCNEPGWCRHCVSLLHRLPGFVTRELFDAARVSTSFKAGAQPDIDETQGKFEGNHPLSNREDIGIIVLP